MSETTAQADQQTTTPNGVRDARLARGWSCETLAARAGISARTIYALERGENKPQASTRLVLALALGVHEVDLFPQDVPEPETGAAT